MDDFAQGNASTGDRTRFISIVDGDAEAIHFLQLSSLLLIILHTTIEEITDVQDYVMLFMLLPLLPRVR